MKLYLIVNKFLGSQGTIKFILNCYKILNKYYPVLNLKEKPQLVYIDEPFYIPLIKKLFFNKEYKFSCKEDKKLFDDYEITKITLIEYYKLKLKKNVRTIGVVDLPRLIIPDIGYIYDCQHIFFKKNFSFLERCLRNFSFISNLIIAKKILVNSKAVKKDLEKFYSKFFQKKIVNLPFVPIEKNIQKNYKYIFEKKYPLFSNTKFILISNRWWDHKNHISVIKAYKNIKPYLDEKFGNRNCTLVLTGSLKGNNNGTLLSEKATKYINKNNLHNHIFILGHVNDDFHNYLFSNCIGVIQPTLFEGGPGGFSAWEAISLEKPLALSKIDINFELIDYVKNIYYFKPKSIKEIQNILVKIYSGKLKNTFLKNFNRKDLNLKYAEQIIKCF